MSRATMAILAAALPLVSVSPLWAQGNKGVGVPNNTAPRQQAPAPKPEPGKTPATGVVQFADERFRLDAVGLVMSLPEGATSQATTIGGRQSVQILPKDTTWVLNVQTPRTSNAEATITEATDRTIALIQGSVGVTDPDQKAVLDTDAKVLAREDRLNLAGGPASRFYITIPSGDGSRLVKGYTIFKPTAMQYVVFELITSEIEFTKARPVYEAIIATASFADSEAVMAERGKALAESAAFLALLNEADYEQAMHDTKAWARLYKPASTGAAMDAEEIGYRGVRFWKGVRGEVDPSKPRGSYNKVEQEAGYLCSIEGRRAVAGRWADSRLICFMSPDRSSEAWSLVMVVRDETGKEVGVATETGARDGSSLNVVTKEPGRPMESISPPVPDGYISQFENYLLPRLLVRRKIQGTMGFYVWSPNRAVSFRKDEVAKVTGAGPRGATWTIRTTFREQDAAQTYHYNDKGDLIRGEIDGQGAAEPMDPAQLFRLWEQKGLPTGKLATDR